MQIETPMFSVRMEITLRKQDKKPVQVQMACGRRNTLAQPKWKSAWRFLRYFPNRQATQLSPLEQVPEGIQSGAHQKKLRIYCCILLYSRDLEPAAE